LMERSQTGEALRRAARRAVIHLLKAGLEGVRALEAVVDELSKVGKDQQRAEDTSRRVRIDVE
jgi:hypothetical protein